VKFLFSLSAARWQAGNFISLDFVHCFEVDK